MGGAAAREYHKQRRRDRPTAVAREESRTRPRVRVHLAGAAVARTRVPVRIGRGASTPPVHRARRKPHARTASEVRAARPREGARAMILPGGRTPNPVASAARKGAPRRGRGNAPDVVAAVHGGRRSLRSEARFCFPTDEPYSPMSRWTPRVTTTPRSTYLMLNSIGRSLYVAEQSVVANPPLPSRSSTGPNSAGNVVSST